METNRDTLRELTAGELRAQLARRRISASELARRIGWKQPYMARRIDGRVALDMDDLELIARALGVAVAQLLPASARRADPVSVRDQGLGGPYSDDDGVTVLYPQLPERVSRKRAATPGHRPNGHPDAGVAPGNRRTGRVPRPGADKRP